jgi:peroxiredoxin
VPYTGANVTAALRSLPLLLAVGCATAAPVAGAPPSNAATTQALPPIELTTLDGQAMHIADVAAGRPALVSLWATWCEACVGELDDLVRLDAATRPIGAVVIAISVGEPRARVADFVRRRGLPYAQLVDEEFRLADALGQTRVPATLVLDRGGRIVYRGAAFDEGALAALRRLVPAQAAR